MKKVSIVVPIYNAEKFIDRCFESLINQTYKNTEIILINDGSKDNSLKIIKEYEKKYDNVHVFSQENKGPGEARNKGISLSTGNYITFVDSDDFIEKDYVEKLMSKSKNMDIVICGYKRYDKDSNLLIEKVPKKADIDYFKFISTVCKLYKREFLIKNNIQFSNRKIGEDMLFTLKCYSLTNKIEKVKYAGYCNIENIHSITHTSSNIANMFELVREIDKTIDLKRYGNLYLFFYLKTIIMNLLMQPKNESFKNYYKLYVDSFNWLEEVYKKNNKKLKIVWLKDEDFKINLCVNTFIFLRKIHFIKPFLFILKRVDIKL